jgi:tetratricopeptide (TPR) repeat protein
MTSDPRAIIVLGMHRCGTSCVAGMLAAGGLASAGDAIRNWDNARGHHENLDAVRLNEAVLAHSGGHWLSQPAEIRWTDAHAAARDRLLTAELGGRAPLLKDPRTLLVLPFWRASRVPFHVIGIVRHPLSVARSLESWRGMPLAEGIALWTVHNRVLADDRARHATLIVDFEAPRTAVVTAVVEWCAAIGASSLDLAALAAAYEEQLVHHDDGDVPAVAGLDEAVALHRRLVGMGTTAVRRPFPRTQLASFEQCLAGGAIEDALVSARAALAAVTDAAAVLVPVVTALVRQRAFAEAAALIAEHAPRLDEGLGDLLEGKVLLASGDAAAAVEHLAAACAVPQPFFQARHLLPQALRAAGRHAEARARLEVVAAEALYPHGPLATLAEWCWLDGDPSAALAQMQRAIDAAPPHRRGRLRTRRAEWLLAGGDPATARDELMRALEEDPGYTRSRDVLGRIS